MAFRRVVQHLTGKQPRVISLDAWNAMRDECFSHLQHSEGKEPLEGFSWISLVCFIEAVDPETLALPATLLKVVNDDVNTLRAMSPLEAYALCLEGLHSADEQGRGEIEAEDVDDQE